MFQLILVGLIMSHMGPAGSAESFTWGGYDGPEGSRRYKLYVPAASSGERRLLVMLHGCTQDPDDLARGTRMNEVAGAQGFVVLYPEQPVTANPLKCWNWFAAANQKRGEGEPAILAAMIRKVASDQKIDPSKVYIAGISAGGAMTAIMGATYPEMFAALGIHSGIAYGLVTQMSDAIIAMRRPRADTVALGELVVTAMAERRKPMPVQIFQGRLDQSVNVENANLLAGQWKHSNGGRHVHVKIVDELAHAWSGGSAAGTYTDEKGPDASKAFVDFFLHVEKEHGHH
ncbi:MAG: extracellular catalytic domain type 1 short-chain-length polyhydroxyalkanoate depolymerase [Gemmatimonadaceae bacterium]